MLVVVDCDVHGRRHFLAAEDGIRESAASWKSLLLSLKDRGLDASMLAVGDGALGFWAARAEVYPEAHEQRCWAHRTMNVLEKLPHGPAKSAPHEIRQADGGAAAEKAFDRFVATYEDNISEGRGAPRQGRRRAARFLRPPAAHWQYIQTTDPIESTFATIRLRRRKTRNCVSAKSALGLMHQLAMSAQKRCRRLRSFPKLAEIKFVDGIDERRISRKAA